MTRRRHTPEQIIRKLAEGQKLLAGGATVEQVCREFQIAESTWARWLNQYGGMKADDAKRLKELERGRPPAFIRFDNGPEFVAHAVVDWARSRGTDTVFIDPGSPWQNAWIESFNGRLRDELLNGWQFDSLLEASVLLEDWRIDYNTNRPHSALDGLTPTEYATLRKPQIQPQPA